MHLHLLRASTFAALMMTFLISGCNGDPADDTGLNQTTTETPPTATAAERGDGTLTLGDDVYSFSVRVCDFSGETDDDMIQTLVGRGDMPDGQPFDLYVSRNEVNNILTHTISFQSGDVRTGEGTVIEAQRMRMGDNWTSVRGGPAMPLIEIDGNRLTASGVFTAADDLDDRTEGRLEATCLP